MNLMSKKIILSVSGTLLSLLCLSIYLFHNMQKNKDAVISSRIIGTTTSNPTEAGCAIALHCGDGSKGSLAYTPANLSFNATFWGKPYSYSSSGKGSGTIKIPPYTCGSQKTHVTKGTKIFRLRQQTVTTRYENTYESGQKKDTIDSKVIWSYAAVYSEDCTYE